MTMLKFKHNGNLLREDFVPANYFKMVDSLLNEAINTGSQPQNFRPATDVLEKENGFELRIALPGLKKENINLELKESKLVLSGEFKDESIAEEEKKPKYHLRESFEGKFSRSFRLPENADKNSIGAEFKDGILIVSIAKLNPKDGITAIEIK